MKLWEKGKDKSKSKLDKRVEEYTVGNDYILDKRLVKYDCRASIAHAKMLNKIGYLNKKETAELIFGLEKIIELDKQGKFEIKKEQEDCHTAIENWLTKKLGNVGKKIHFCRSRNDQILVALRLYEKDEINEIKKETNNLISSISNFALKYGNVNMPGYTHTRKAMPSSVEMWAGSLINSLQDDKKLLNASYNLIDQCPLGSGPGYGLPVKIDREFTAQELGFARVQENPIYCQNSRGKFEADILHSLSQVMLTLNKAASDIILFSIPEIGYVRNAIISEHPKNKSTCFFDVKLPDEICTGSSIMPHKKNPDVLELVRANYHIVNSHEFQVKGILSNLISGYNRDLQLTKEPLMKGFDTTKESLAVMSLVFENLKVNENKCKKAMTPELFSVQEAYKLVKKGMSFRDAYKKISQKHKR